MPDVIAMPGAPNATSYVSPSEANAYLQSRLDAEAWFEDGIRQAQALISATRMLDDLDFHGRRATADQALEWPRIGATARDGGVLPDDMVPPELKRAQIELAFHLSLYGMAGSEDDEIERVSIGPVTISPVERGVSSTIPSEVRKIIRHLLRVRPGNVGLVRA